MLFFMKKYTFVIVSIFSLVFLQGCIFQGAQNKTGSPAVPEASEQKPSSTVSILKDKPGYQYFLTIKGDMTKEQADAAMGAGKKVQKDALPVEGDDTYEYEKDGQTIWLEFSNNKLLTKEVPENPDWSVSISMEDLKGIDTQMPMFAMTDLLGEGQVIEEEFLQPYAEDALTYLWNVKVGDLKYTVTFRNRSVTYYLNMD